MIRISISAGVNSILVIIKGDILSVIASLYETHGSIEPIIVVAKLPRNEAVRPSIMAFWKNPYLTSPNIAELEISR